MRRNEGRKTANSKIHCAGNNSRSTDNFNMKTFFAARHQTTITAAHFETRFPPASVSNPAGVTTESTSR